MKNFFKDHGLVKILLISILFAVVLSWIIPSGYFSGAEYISYGLRRIGIFDIFLTGAYSINYFVLQVTFLLVLGLFYGVLSKVPGYQVLVGKVTKWVKGKEIPFVLVVTFLTAAFVGVNNDVFAALVFAPFIITVLLRAKMDKITAFSATFGGILIGLIGATYSGTGLNFLNDYLGTGFNTLLWVKVVIFFFAFALFNFFTISRINKSLKEKTNEEDADLFAVEDTKKGNVVPVVIILSLIAVITILGYVSWSAGFELTLFTKFHEWLIGFEIGGHAVFSYILGSAAEFGAWDLFGIQTVMIIATIVFGFMSKLGLNGVLKAMAEGMKKMLKPLLVLLLVNCIFVVVYWSPYVSTVVNWIMNLTKSFNVYLASLSGLFAGLFHVDYAFTGYALGSFFAGNFGDFKDIIMIVLNSTNGLMRFFAPTSAVLLVGLSYLGISYKSWMKHIWKFLVGMLIVLLIIFTMITYI